MKKQFLRIALLICALAALLTAGTAATDNVYAILYGDGTLVFQHGDTPASGRTVTATYPVDLADGYTFDRTDEDPANWGPNMPWYSARESITAVDFADTISPQSTAFWFYDCTNLAEITNLANLDTSNVTDMQYMFYNCFKLTELDVSGFDTSNVTTMSNMFVYCMWLTTLDVSGFDTSHVTDMSYMFSDCNRLTALDVSGFDTSNVTNMMYMFAYCKGLAMLDLSGFDTSHVTSMSQMFYACDGLATLDLSAFDTSRVTDMLQMFAYCNILTTIRASERFMTSQVTEGRYMFSDCTALVGGNGTQYTADHEDAEYARIDTAAAPGYFTYAAAPITPTPTPAPVSVFSAPTSHGQPITAANLATLTEITVPVQYTGDTAQSVTVAVAFYDDNGRFAGFGITNDSVSNGGKDVTVLIGGVTDAAQVKAFVLDTGLAPLCEAGAYDIPAA